MLTRNKEQKCEELKKYKDEKLSQQDVSLREMCSALIENFTKEMKSEIKNNWTNKMGTCLESNKAMLQKQIK